MSRSHLQAFAISFLAMAAFACFAQQRDKDFQPNHIDPGSAAKAPSDAVVLFDGKDGSKWRRKDGSPNRCEVADGVMACTTGAGDIVSTEKFRDAQIHLEFAPPSMPDQKGQRKGNSGVYIQGVYEVQILDSYNNPTYGHGMLGGLYNQAPPLVNVARPPGEWQAYDMIFHAPLCDESGNIKKKATLTVLLNGVLVHDHVTVNDTKGGCEPGPILLQDHSGFPGAPTTTMKFRNIWFRNLEPQAE